MCSHKQVDRAEEFATSRLEGCKQRAFEAWKCAAEAYRSKKQNMNLAHWFRQHYMLTAWYRVTSVLKRKHVVDDMAISYHATRILSATLSHWTCFQLAQRRKVLQMKLASHWYKMRRLCLGFMALKQYHLKLLGMRCHLENRGDSRETDALYPSATGM